MFSTGTYRAFFNRMDNATIKNLTIHVADFEQTDAEEHGYAAFAGNMNASVLENCTATGAIGTIAKPAMSTCGGFAVKVDSGGVFVNCTNHISIVCSLNDNPKVGGIAGLFQGGVLTNCWNDGDITITCKKCANAGNGAGGLIGYAQTSSSTIYHSGNAGTIQSTDTTTNGGNFDIKVGTIIGMQNSQTATIAGGTIAQTDKDPAGAIANVTGVNFATVDGNVATFVADNALALNGEYKVMATGATATYAFAASGTIAFDEAMYTPTYAITAAEGLDLTNETVGTVKTYTAAVSAPQGFNDPQGTAIEDPAVIDWLRDNGFDQDDIDGLGQNAAGTEKLYKAYILNYDFTKQGADGTLSISAITVDSDIAITVQLVRTAPLGAINGVLYLYGSNNLTAGFSRSPIDDTFIDFTGDETFATQASDGSVTQSVTATFSASDVTAKFFKAVIQPPIVDNGGESGEPEPDPDPETEE
jgi:hypothetical protein